MNVHSRCLIPVALSHAFEQMSDQCLESDIPEIADLCINYLEQWQSKWQGGKPTPGRWKGMADDDMTIGEANKLHQEQRTNEDEGFEAIAHVVACDAVERATMALAHLRRRHPSNDGDLQRWLLLKHRVLGESIGLLQKDLYDINECLDVCCRCEECESL